MKNKKIISLLISFIVLIVLSFEFGNIKDIPVLIEKEKVTSTSIVSSKELVTLVKSVDGDTANFSTSSYGNVNVRLSGVNTPETKHPTLGKEYYGTESSEFTKNKLETANRIEIEWDLTQSPSHNRPIGIVFVDGVNLNLLLVKEGYADLRYLEEDMPYAKEYIKALDFAKNNNLGRWK